MGKKRNAMRVRGEQLTHTLTVVSRDKFSVRTQHNLGDADARNTLTLASTLLAKVLQPGWYRLVRNIHAAARNLTKYLQTSIIIGRVSTGQKVLGATLDQLVLVRTQVRQLCESSADYLSRCARSGRSVQSCPVDYAVQRRLNISW